MPQQISCKVLRHVLHIAIYRSSIYHYMGVSIDEGRQNPFKMDDLGLLPFMETPIYGVYIYINLHLHISLYCGTANAQAMDSDKEKRPALLGSFRKAEMGRLVDIQFYT